MRKNPSRTSIRARRRGGVLRMLGDSQSGFTIIEVVVASVMLTLMAGATATALIATNAFSGDQRSRSQADEIAQQDQERLKGLSIKALSGLKQMRFVDEAGAAWVSGTSTGTKYAVYSTGKFLSNTGAGTCASNGSGAAAYVLVTSTVNWDANLTSSGDLTNAGTWDANSRRPPIKQQSLITPSAGGILIANVKDEVQQPLDGVTVTTSGPEVETDTTDTDGCVVFGGIATGDGYNVTYSRSGFVNPDGVATFGSTSPTTVTGTGTAFPFPDPVRMGQAGLISAFFKTTVTGGLNGPTYTDQRAPSISWIGSGGALSMTASQNNTPGTVPSNQVNTPVKLFPFNSGTSSGYTDNYSVWAGKCDAAKPPAANLTKATIGKGGWAILNGSPSPQVALPAMVIKVSYPTAGTYVTPEHIKLTDSCSQTWSIPAADIRPTTDAGFATLGALDFPGQPYGTYSVCADYDPPGAVLRRKLTVPSVANTSFTAGNPAPVVLTASTGDASGTGC